MRQGRRTIALTCRAMHVHKASRPASARCIRGSNRRRHANALMSAIAGGSSSFNQNLNLWSLPSGTIIRERVTAHSNGVTSIAFSPDGQTLATAGRESAAKLWSIPDLALVGTFGGSVGYSGRNFG